MKTRIGLLAISLFVAVGLSSCYTEFATTGNDYYGQGSQGYYYDSSSSGYVYDSTGAPIANNYNYYGYGYPSYDYYDNWWTPSPWWWRSDLSFNFGWGYNPWYDGGWGWGNPYSYYGYGYSPFYSPYYYSPFYPYGNGYAYQPVNPTGRVRNIGDTRNGRDSYGGGSTGTYVQPVGTSTGVGGANATGGASANTGQTSTRTRTSTPSSTGNTSSGTVNQPRTRSGDQQPQSQPPQQQPRTRDNGGGGGSNQGNGRSRGGSMSSYRNTPSPQRVRYYWRPQQVNRPTANRSSWTPATNRGYAQPRTENAPSRSTQAVRSSAPAPSRSGGGSGSSGGRTRH